MAVFNGTSASEMIFGGFDPDVLRGRGGDDTLFGDYDNDTVFGGEGNDLFETSDGDDLHFGGTGDDTFIAAQYAAENDRYFGGDGHDTLVLSTFFQASDLVLDSENSVEVLDADQTVFTLLSPGANLINLRGVIQIVGNFNWELGTGADKFFGSGDGDRVFGGAGDDRLFGFGGNDTLTGDDGADVLYGGLGDDVFDLSYAGTQAGDRLFGGNGDDTVLISSYTSIGSLLLDKTASIEHLVNLSGFDVNGTNGNDVIDLRAVTRYSQGVSFDLESGDDRFSGSVLDDSVAGGEGNDIIFGRGGNDTISGGNGDNHLYGGIGDDLFIMDFATYGHTDSYRGGSGTDQLTIEVFASVNRLILDKAASVEVLNMEPNNGFLAGTAGDDVIDLSGVGTILFGLEVSFGQGADYFVGSVAAETVHGASGNDILIGRQGDDVLFGDGSDDLLVGGAGQDRLYGGTGQDTMTGGAGYDVFVFENNWGHDVITDFSAKNREKIDLSAVDQITDFTDLVTSHLRDNSGQAEIFVGTNSILLEGITLNEIGVGKVYSGADFIF